LYHKPNAVYGHPQTPAHQKNLRSAGGYYNDRPRVCKNVNRLRAFKEFCVEYRSRSAKKHRISALGRKDCLKKAKKRLKKTKKDKKSTGFGLKKHKNDEF